METSPTQPRKRKPAMIFERLRRVDPWRRHLLLLLSLGIAYGAYVGYAQLEHFDGLIPDDSYISYRFAENLANGFGPTWNPHMDPVEGFTCMLWVLMLGAFQFVSGLRPHEFAHDLGFSIWLVYVGVVLPIGFSAVAPLRQLFASERLKTVAYTAFALFGFFILIKMKTFVFHSMTGMETMLHIFLFASISVCALDDNPRRGAVLVGLASMLSFVNRPDSPAFFLPVWTLLLWFAPRAKRKMVLLVFLSFGFALAVYFVVKWSYYGLPVPNTFFIKKSFGGLPGWDYVLHYLRSVVLFLPMVAYVLFRHGWRAIVLDRKFLLTCAPALIFTLAYMRFQPIGAVGARFVIPTFPAFFLAFVRLVTIAFERMEQEPMEEASKRHLTTRIAECGIVLLLCLVPLNALASSEARGLTAGTKRGVEWIDYVNKETGLALYPASRLATPPTIGVADAGATPYFSRLIAYDIVGLCDEEVTQTGFTHEYIRQKSIDLYILQDIYLKPVDSPIVEDDVTVRIQDVLRALDLPRYRRSRHWRTGMEWEHSGRGTTFQVLTAPEPRFVNEYVHINDWDYVNGRDRYYAFLKKSYPHFDEVRAMLLADRGPAPTE